MIFVNFLDHILETLAIFLHILYILHDHMLFFLCPFWCRPVFQYGHWQIRIWQRESGNVIVVILITSFPSTFIRSHFVYFELQRLFFPSSYSFKSEIVHICLLILLSLEPIVSLIVFSSFITLSLRYLFTIVI